jgi:Rrf2 family protein
MRITSKGEYAAKAVLYLAQKHPAIVPIQEIAKQHRIPLKYLEQILLMLKNAGLLRSRRGIKGGYQLAKPPGSITVGAVVTAVDGNFAQTGCPDTVQPGDYQCPDFAICGLKSLWAELKTAVEAILNGTTFDDLRKRAPAGLPEKSFSAHA